jgi:putative endonuclease
LILRLKGYRSVACRYRVGDREIDIVARRGDAVAFVEVKVGPTLDEARIAIDFVASLARALGGADAIYIAPWRWPRHSRRSNWIWDKPAGACLALPERRLS